MPPTTTYTLTRVFDGDDSPYHSTSFTSSDTDAINCAHMLAAGFNTMSRNFMHTFVMGVIDTQDGRVFYDGKVETIKRGDEPTRSAYAHVARSVLEEAYADYMGIRERMYEAGVETIPVSAGVDELRSIIDAREERFRERAEADEAARAEMISFVKRAHAKKLRIQAAGEPRPELDDRWRGMLDVLAKFLVVTGEADKDEGHAVARRLCGIEEEMH